MAGLGETCTHVAATLFFLEAVHRHKEPAATVTGVPCQWKVPTFQKEMEYARVADIDFSSPQQRQEALDRDVSPPPSPKRLCVKLPSDAEKQCFYKNLASLKTKPAVLSVIKPFLSGYVPASTSPTLPKPLNSLYQEECLAMSHEQLLDVCAQSNVDISEREVAAVETATRMQSGSRVWFEQRAGRVTASRMYDICHTSAQSPSRSLIQAICYPDPLPKGAPSTRWGQEHEGPARERYTAMISANHMNFEVSDSGLVISKELPFIAASPDGIVQCDCCGSGLVEVKCPYTHRGTPLDSASQDKKFCLEMVGSKLQLKRTHAYYLQIQTQLYVTGADFCDLCLCLFCEDGKNDLHVERIYPDCDAWKDFITKAKKFFFGCILPELVGKWYTSKGARLSIGTTMGPQQPPPMLSPAREATSSSTVQMTTQSLSLQSAASIAQVQYPMASSLALHSPSMVKACCKSGCSYSLDLRPCRCGHHFHHICTTDEDGKLCACCYTAYPFL